MHQTQCGKGFSIDGESNVPKVYLSHGSSFLGSFDLENMKLIQDLGMGQQK